MGDSTKIVKTEYGPVEVHKMPLADYAELLKALENIPQVLTSFFADIEDDKLQKMSNFDYAIFLPGLLAESWNDLISLVAVPTDKDAKFMAKLDMADAVDVVSAILELNDLPRIAAAVKKMLALRAKLTQPAKPKQT